MLALAPSAGKMPGPDRANITDKSRHLTRRPVHSTGSAGFLPGFSWSHIGAQFALGDGHAHLLREWQMNTDQHLELWVVNGRPFASLAAARDFLDYRENLRSAPCAKARGFGAAVRAFCNRRASPRDIVGPIRGAARGRVVRAS